MNSVAVPLEKKSVLVDVNNFDLYKTPKERIERLLTFITTYKRKSPGSHNAVKMFAYIPLENARLCPDCRIVFVSDNCPICSSGAFLQIARCLGETAND